MNTKPLPNIDDMSDEEFDKFTEQEEIQAQEFEEPQEPAPESAEPAPEQQQSAKDGGPPPDGYVNHGRFHKERERRKEAEDGLTKAQTENQDLKTKLETISTKFQEAFERAREKQAQQQPQQPAQPQPIHAEAPKQPEKSFEERYKEAQERGDYAAMIDVQGEMLRAQQEKLNQYDQQIHTRQEQIKATQHQEAQLAQADRISDQLFVEAEQTGIPATEALQHLALQNMRELMVQNPNVRQDQAAAYIKQQVRMTMAGYLEKGINPIGPMMQMAMAKGFNPDAIPAQGEQPQAGQPNGQQNGGQISPQAMQAAQDMQAKADTRMRATTLSVSGSDPQAKDVPSIEAYANMSDEDMDQLIAQFNGDEDALARAVFGV